MKKKPKPNYNDNNLFSKVTLIFLLLLFVVFTIYGINYIGARVRRNNEDALRLAPSLNIEAGRTAAAPLLLVPNRHAEEEFGARAAASVHVSEGNDRNFARGDIVAKAHLLRKQQEMMHATRAERRHTTTPPPSRRKKHEFTYHIPRTHRLQWDWSDDIQEVDAVPPFEHADYEGPLPDHTLSVLLTRRTRSIEPVSNLTNHPLMKDDEKELIGKLPSVDDFRALLPDDDIFLDSKAERFKSCVVVGNSGLMRNASLGETIDDYDAVFRLNWPPLAGYERDAGTKTTFMFVNRKNMMKSVWPPYVSYREYPRTVRIVTMLHFLKEYHAFMQWAHHTPKSRDRLFVINPRWRSACTHEILTQMSRAGRDVQQASTGLIATSVALSVCDEVHLYGFGTSVYSGNGHYYAPRGDVVREWHIHDFGVEQQLFRQLETRRTRLHFLGDRHSNSIVFHRDEQSKAMIDDLLRKQESSALDKSSKVMPDPRRAARLYAEAQHQRENRPYAALHEQEQLRLLQRQKERELHQRQQQPSN